MSKWLSSTNAKEIGTLYLVFSVFAGMIFFILILPAIKIYLSKCWNSVLVNLLQNLIVLIITLFKMLLNKCQNCYYLHLPAIIMFLLRDLT